MGLTYDPSIYLNLLRGNDGRFLSSDDMGKLLDRMALYLRQDAQPRPDQTEIDNRFDSSWRPKPGNQLRYRPSDRSQLVINQWIKLAREIYCTNPTDSTTASRLVPSEVGWATSAVDRCKAHAKNDTNSLFGLVQAILNLRPSQGGFSHPPPMQVVLFYLWKRDKGLCRVSEIVGSLLARSYWTLGGLNAYFAGGFPFSDEDAQAPSTKTGPPASNAQNWSHNAKLVWRRLTFEDDRPEPEKTAQDWLDKYFQALKLETLKDELKTARNAVKRTEEDRAIKQDEIDALASRQEAQNQRQNEQLIKNKEMFFKTLEFVEKQKTV